MNRYLQALALLACLAMYSGCGGPHEFGGIVVHPVSGKATYDGEPLVDASVVLHPVAPTGDDFYLPRGKVQSDGTFQLSTYSQFDGAPEGEYKVVFDWVGSHDGLSEDEIDELEQQLPEEYTSPELTEFKVVIQAGENQLEEFLLN
jgi:hypothetical protein